ncbi:hypothetical protein [Rhodococcus jostii]|uniref:Uncharacterized protein n=1 Tax=Rhodococcus jostii TaxID=132919 RepID=A0A1H4IQM6_RHOJO|nr:hypothetical protein [Rhodococcus jostii]SEB36360.1 hypothetical protein SAMN04490220_0391 [Rhodococcus jostii]
MKRITARAAVAATALACLTALGAGTAAAAAPTLDEVAGPAARVVAGSTGTVTDMPNSGFPWAWPWPSGPFEPGRPFDNHGHREFGGHRGW